MCKDMASVMAQRRNIIQSSMKTGETIHSGHFMVSHFEADAQDDEYEVAVPVPEVSSKKLELIPLRSSVHKNVNERHLTSSNARIMSVSIETSLTKLFQCMSIAYRQKLTSPKWNRFRGVRLRWKEKIRLNNVIWRCWHMQFVKRRNIGVCQFASPLDVDVHSKPEAVVLEGKYWKRKLSAVTAEYKRWRIFYQKLASSPVRDQCDLLAELTEWSAGSVSLAYDSDMMMDEDYTDFMSDTLFTTIAANQPFAFPDTREIARAAGLADLIQPSLVQLQPNLDDYMDMLEPLPDLLSPPTKLSSVPEEYHPSDDLYRPLNTYDDVCNTPTFYPHQSTSSPSTSNAMNTLNSVAPASVAGAAGENMEQKLYVKLEQEQPLQLSVAAHNLSQKTSSSYRNIDSAMYHDSNSASMYSSGGGGGSTGGGAASASYASYHEPNYQTTGQLAGQENAIVNYSHQMNKNVSAQYNNCHYSSSYDATAAANCYVPSSNVTQHHQPQPQQQQQQQQQQQGYSPSSSSNYKILPSSRSARSSSLSTNNEEEMFAVPKLSQRGRSRSGSSLLNAHARFLPNDPYGAADTVQNCALLSQLLTNSNRYYSYPSGYGMGGGGGGACPNTVVAAASGGRYSASGSAHDIRTCYTINGHREVAHCTALLGRRSRTPDHILSSNSNPVGYSKPRTPVLSSQNTYHEGSLINLSQSVRDRSAVPETVTEEHDHTDTHSSFAYSSSRHNSLYGSSLKSESEKYSNTSAFHAAAAAVAAQTWNSTGSYSSSINSGSPIASNPFVFGANQQHSNSESSTLSQLMSSQASTSSSPKHPSSPSTSESLSLSPLTVSSPPGASSPPSSKSSTTPYKEHRRVCHINAEQKRRCNIKNGFDTLHQLIPHLAQTPNIKMSKAAMLQKGAEYIRTLQGDRSQLRAEITSLRKQVETLSASISNCHSLLPVTGAPVARHKTDNKMKEMFDEYVKERTKQNWKFWILSLICEPLLNSFNSSVSNANIDELFRTTLQWAEKHCSLVDLRPVVMNAMRNISTSTEVLSNPHQLPDEARAIVLRNSSSSTTNSNRN